MEGNGCVEKFIVSEQLEKKRTFPALTWSEDFSVQVIRLAPVDTLMHFWKLGLLCQTFSYSS